MKGTALVVLAVFCCLSVAGGQWLEATIYLPDSFGGVGSPRYLVYNTTNNTIYVGGEYGDCVIAIDGATDQRIARIPAGSGIYALCCNPQTHYVKPCLISASSGGA
jgi:YVTN family beta-propeller protein